MSEFETIDYRVDDGVAVLRLDRPRRHNAVNSVMHRELPLAWERFRADADAVVAIVIGSGDTAFCTGADLADLPLSGAAALRGGVDAMRWTSHQNAVWKPVICAVNGMTVGGGLHFVADSDIVIASEHATFFDAHVRAGMVAGLEPVSLARRMPLEAVLRMALLGDGERLNTRRALELGLISECLPGAELLPRARAIAKLITRNSPSAMARTKRAIWQAQEMNLRDGLENAWRLITEQLAEPDFSEGPRAFVEKREPRWEAYDGD